MSGSVGVLVLACGAGTGVGGMIEEWGLAVASPSGYDRYAPAGVTGPDTAGTSGQGKERIGLSLFWHCLFWHCLF